MKVAIGSDHRGVKVKQWIGETLQETDCSVIDVGTHSTESCDYPDIAAQVARQVSDGEVDRGILVCGSGIGMSIAANKFSGVRAALCVDAENAALSRRHNDANILCLGADSAEREKTAELVRTWIAAPFESGRHARRVNKLAELDCQPKTANPSNAE